MPRRGDAIPDSRYTRDFCARCGEPIRVNIAPHARRDDPTRRWCDACIAWRPLR